MENKLYPEIVVGIFFQNSNGEIALFKSRKWKDKLVTIGGHVEYGETLENAAIREAKEEAGVDVKEIKFLRFGELINSSDFFRDAHLVFFHYLCLTDQELKIDNDEVTEYKWFSTDEISKLKNINNYLLQSIDKIKDLNR